MEIKYHQTHLLCKQVLKVHTWEKTEEKEVKVGWFKKEIKTTTRYNCRLDYIDMSGDHATYDWHSAEQKDVDLAYKEISAQVSAQLETLSKKVVDKAVDAILLGDNKDVNSN